MASKNEYLKFSFYGRTAVGKTSMLAALDMPRVDTKGGKISPLQNVTTTDPQGDSEEAQLLRGHAAVATAVCDLRDPNIGKAEGNAVDDKVMQIRCEFPSGKPNGPRHKVVLYEYAGEIIESAELNNEDSLINYLHQRLEDCDAFLLVVEAPIPKAEIADFTADMHKLVKAFAAIWQEKSIKGRLHIPVLMLITKWDRYEPNPDTEKQDERLEQFFTDYPTFKGVRDALASGVNEDMFEVFPVSALGTVDNDGTDNPKCKLVDGAIQSYGLEEPFIWAADKVKDQRRTKRNKMFLKAVWSAVGVVAAILVGDALQWNRAYSVARTNAESATGDSNDYTNLLTGYAGSSLPKNLLWRLTYSKEDARNERDGFERKGQEDTWATIQAEPDLLTKVILAKRYKKKWENGINIVAVNKIIDTVDVEQDKSKVQQVTKHVDKRIDDATEQELNSLKIEVGNTRNSLKNPEMFESDLVQMISSLNEKIRQRKLEADNEKVESLTKIVYDGLKSDSESELDLLSVDIGKIELFDQDYFSVRLDLLNNKIKARIREIKEKMDEDEKRKAELAKREKFKAQVVSELDAKNYLEAGDLLDSRCRAETDPSWLEPLVSIFLQQLPGGYKQKLAHYTLTKLWKDGNHYLEKLETRRTSWHRDIKSEDFIQSVRTSRTEFNTAHDKYLYQQVVVSPTTIEIDRYLGTAPLQTMAKQVKAYQSWVSKTSSGDQEYNFTLTGIVWDSKAYARNNWVQVWYEDKEIINIEKVPSVTGQPTVIPSSAKARFSWNPQKKNKVNIRIKVTGDGYIDFDHGDGAGEFKLDTGAEQLVLPSDGCGIQKANFTIEPFNAKPKLPPWSNL